MKRRNWKKLQPTSLRDALELCKDFALSKNQSLDRIAERMGLADKWSLYKWLENGRMPAVLIPAYESACGTNYVTKWLAARDGKLLIDIPTGKALSSTDVNELQGLFHSAVGALLEFYQQKKPAEETLADITNALEGLAWHRCNVEQHNQPQLDLGGSDA